MQMKKLSSFFWDWFQIVLVGGDGVSVFFFSIYIQLLGKDIWWWSEYADDTWFYISTPGYLSDVLDILSQCLEVV